MRYVTTTSIIYELASTANNWECVVSVLIDGLVDLNASFQGIYNLHVIHVAYDFLISNFSYCTCICMSSINLFHRTSAVDCRWPLSIHSYYSTCCCSCYKLCFIKVSEARQTQR